jgi:hypothetical protein
VSLPKVIYHARKDATPESELSALGAVYKFLLESAASKKATCPGGPDDAEDLRNDRTATENYTG